MEGSAKIISLIARDENQHLAITQNILNKWAAGDDLKQSDHEEEMDFPGIDRTSEEERRSLFRDDLIGLERYFFNVREWITDARLVVGLISAIVILPQR